MNAKKQLGELLVEAEIITVKTLERALERQYGSGKRLGLILEEMGVLTDRELVETLARQFGFKTVTNISSYTFPQELFDLIPCDLAVQKHIFPLSRKDMRLAVAVNNPFDSDTFDFLAKRTGLQIVTVLASREDIQAAINRHYLKNKPQEADKTRILIIEDSQSVASIIEVALNREGYETFIGNDGVEGLKLAITHKPDLIICDLVMPRMDGYGLLRAIKSNPDISGIPVILLTSKATPEDEQQALDSGFFDFIAKPVKPVRVISRVKRALELVRKINL